MSFYKKMIIFENWIFLNQKITPYLWRDKMETAQIIKIQVFYWSTKAHQKFDFIEFKLNVKNWKNSNWEKIIYRTLTVKLALYLSRLGYFNQILLSYWWRSSKSQFAGEGGVMNIEFEFRASRYLGSRSVIYFFFVSYGNK